MGTVPTSPAFAAFQDGDGPWQVLTGTGGVFDFQVARDRYSVAVVCTRVISPGNLSIDGRTYHVLITEAQSLSHFCPTPYSVPVGHDVSVTVTGLVDGTGVFCTGHQSIGLGPMFSLVLPSGTYDAVVTHHLPPVLTRVIYRKDLSVSGPVTWSFDVASEGFPPQISPVAVRGLLPGEGVSLRSRLHSDLGTNALLGGSNGTSGLSYASLPVAQLRGNDVHALETTVNLGRDARVTRYVRQGTPTELDVPVPIDPPLIYIVETAPYLRFRTEAGDRTDTDLYEVTYDQTDDLKRFWRWVHTVGSGWGGFGSFSYTTPSLSGLAGWDDAWGCSPGLSTTWTFSATTGNRRIEQLLEGPFLLPERVRPRPGLDGWETSVIRVSGNVVPD